MFSYGRGTPVLGLDACTPNTTLAPRPVPGYVFSPLLSLAAFLSLFPCPFLWLALSLKILSLQPPSRALSSHSLAAGQPQLLSHPGLLPLLKRHIPPRSTHLPGQWLQCQANGSNVCRVLR